MDFINKIFAPLFKKHDSKNAFLPFGSLSKGYELADKAKKDKIDQFLKMFFIVGVVALIISILVGFELFILVVVVLAVWYWAHTTSLVKGCKSFKPRKAPVKKDDGGGE